MPSLFEQVTEKIIAAIEAGADINHMPWHSTGAALPGYQCAASLGRGAARELGVDSAKACPSFGFLLEDRALEHAVVIGVIAPAALGRIDPDRRGQGAHEKLRIGEFGIPISALSAMKLSIMAGFLNGNTASRLSCSIILSGSKSVSSRKTSLSMT